jgi:hypothetical protein
MISFLIFQIPFLRKRFETDTPPLPSPKGREFISKVFSYYLLISSILISLVLMLSYPYSYNKTATKPESQTLKIKELADKKNADKIILLNTPGTMSLLYMNDIYRFHAGKYNDLYILYGGNGKIWLNKLNDSAFALKTNTKGWLTNFFAKLPRTNLLIDKNRIYENKDFSVRIVETTPDKEDILETEIRFKNSLISPGFVMIYFDGNELKVLEFKGQKNGEWMLLGDTSDILKYLL